MNIYAHRVSVVGITGYAGQELERLLASHPKIGIDGRFASKADPKAGIEAFTVENVRAHSPDVCGRAHELLLAFGGRQLADAGDDDVGPKTKHRSRSVSLDRLETFWVDPIGNRANALGRKP